MSDLNTWQWLAILGILTLLFILPLMVLALLLWLGAQWARRAFERFVTPDPVALEAHMGRLRARNPGISEAELVRRIIARESMKVGLVGAVTGIGGIVTLPIAIPIDFALTARLQAALVHFIAHVHAPAEAEEALRLKTYAILAGNRFTQQVVEASSRAVQAAVARVVTRLLAESFAEALLKIVPLIGAAVGFGLNYAATRAVGRLAVNWYRGRPAVTDQPMLEAAPRPGVDGPA